jgi:hypothetical protein
MYASAAAWAMGRTVVEPATDILSFPDDAAEEPDDGDAAVVAWAPVAGVAATSVAVIEDAAGVVVDAGVAVDVVVPVLVHPATNIDTTSNAARHNVTIKYELCLTFMVFDHEVIPC